MRVRELIRALNGADPDATVLHLALFADACDATPIDDMIIDGRNGTALERVRHLRPNLVTWRDEQTPPLPDGCVG